MTSDNFTKLKSGAISEHEMRRIGTGFRWHGACSTLNGCDSTATFNSVGMFVNGNQRTPKRLVFIGY